MQKHAGAPVSRRRFLALGGTAAATAALGGCALPVSGSVGGSGETVTLMVNPDDISTDLIKQAQKDIGIGINTVRYDITKLIAMMTSGSAPDLVRGVGAVDTPYLAARGIAEDLDPCFPRSTVLKVSDLDPVNDLWRYDGRTQGKGPRHGMAKDFSQDSMYWYGTALFDSSGVDCPPETEPITYEEWLDKARRLTRTSKGQTTVFGGTYNGLGASILLAGLTASAGGSMFSDDFTRVDFTAPEAHKALNWYIEVCRARVGTSLIQPNPNAWDGPTYQARRLAMYNAGYWVGGLINTDKKLAAVTRLAPAPVFAGGPRLSTCQGGTGLWMPKKANLPRRSVARSPR
ncbi:extracellular solute-binding protein [Streptomyces sp. NPDC096040]|uniref:ABC transporter substrate-binding protein n=1 Tax=Streptomyces sp. NPDC096040 TaxID=3155541 RepID=UPI00332579DD